MAANSSISLVGLDFDSIKSNFITYLQSQDTFKDYNFLGSGLNTLLDVLAYNTQYNAFYLNMVANEMFLDTALQRSSVVSHAKLLDYVPKSSIAPTAFVNISCNNITASSLTLPYGTNFLSESVDGVNYNFITVSDYTTNINNGSGQFNNIELKQGIAVTYSYTVDSTSNPSFTFDLPDNNIDTSTIKVYVQQSSSNTSNTVYSVSDSYSIIQGNYTDISTAPIYFIQEGLTGNYQIYFGDGIIGNLLSDGNIVVVTYLVTQGTSSFGANNFTLMDSVPGFVNTTVYGVTPASQGAEKESIDSIKFQAPKSYASQNRGVTKDDYITLLQQNTIGITFDAVNVWGGQENNPPVYGQVFLCVKPTGAYVLTDTQKQRLITEVIKPISVMTVTPVLVDPDYTYIKTNSNVLYDSSKTTLTANQIQSLVNTTIQNYSINNLNTFNSTFSSSDLIIDIQNSEKSIIANEINIQLQKKIYLDTSTTKTYTMYFNVPLEKGMFQSGITSYPAMQFVDISNPSTIIDGVYIEEVPSSTGGVYSVSITNPGYSYQYTPTVNILGDGTGATAEAIINTNGTLRSINVLTTGNNYTSAIATITPASGDTTGAGGAAVVTLEGQYGTLRTYYSNPQQVKTILNSNVGTVDYVNGIIQLNSFGPIGIDNPLSILTITANPTSSIISSSQNMLVTIDPFDPNAITVSAKTK